LHKLLVADSIFTEEQAMRRIEKIKREIQELLPTELAAFRKWYSEFNAAAWDLQIEEDAKTGKLDELANVAEKAFKLGRCTKI
jgi:hypothetical protein